MNFTFYRRNQGGVSYNFRAPGLGDLKPWE